LVPARRIIDLNFLAFHNVASSMANLTNGFLVLPTELRLEGYRTLLKECLADGWAQDFAGLFLCCREVHQELELEFMTRFRPLLTAKYEWETTSLQKTPLRFLVKPRPCRNMIKPELSVDISLLVLVVKRKVKMHDILPKLALCLRPVLALNWSVLTLSTKVHIRDSLRITSIFRGFFHTLDYRTKASSRYFQGVDRLVLSYGKPGTAVTKRAFGVALLTYCHTRNYFACLHQPRSIIQACISKVFDDSEPGWRLTLDFKDGLSLVRGGLWRLGAAAGLLTADRLFECMDEVHSNDNFESALNFPSWRFDDYDDGSDVDDDLDSEEEAHSEYEMDDASDNSEEFDMESELGDEGEDEMDTLGDSSGQEDEYETDTEAEQEAE
jgi:hypothetical protein